MIFSLILCWQLHPQFRVMSWSQGFSHFSPFEKKCRVPREFECEGARALELIHAGGLWSRWWGRQWDPARQQHFWWLLDEDVSRLGPIMWQTRGDWGGGKVKAVLVKAVVVIMQLVFQQSFLFPRFSSISECRTFQLYAEMGTAGRRSCQLQFTSAVGSNCAENLCVITDAVWGYSSLRNGWFDSCHMADSGYSNWWGHELCCRGRCVGRGGTDVVGSAAEAVRSCISWKRYVDDVVVGSRVFCCSCIFVFTRACYPVPLSLVSGAGTAVHTWVDVELRVIGQHVAVNIKNPNRSWVHDRGPQQKSTFFPWSGVLKGGLGYIPGVVLGHLARTKMLVLPEQFGVARLLEDIVELVYVEYPLSVIRGLVHSLRKRRGKQQKGQRSAEVVGEA